MKTLSDHAEDIRRERTERLEADIQAAAAQRLAADAERERYAALAGEVGLPPDAPPAEVTRLHNLRKEQFWSEFVNSNTASADTRFRELAAEVGVDITGLHDPRTAVWNVMRQKNHPLLGGIQAAA